MKIVVKQQGGFTGIERVVAEVDTRNLGEEKAEQLEKVVNDLDFFGNSLKKQAETGADLMQYEITISEASRKKTVVFTDHPDAKAGSTAQKLRALIDLLQTC